FCYPKAQQGKRHEQCRRMRRVREREWPGNSQFPSVTEMAAFVILVSLAELFLVVRIVSFQPGKPPDVPYLIVEAKILVAPFAHQPKTNERGGAGRQNDETDRPSKRVCHITGEESERQRLARRALGYGHRLVR